MQSGDWHVRIASGRWRNNRIALVVIIRAMVFSNRSQHMGHARDVALVDHCVRAAFLELRARSIGWCCRHADDERARRSPANCTNQRERRTIGQNPIYDGDVRRHIPQTFQGLFDSCNGVTHAKTGSASIASRTNRSRIGSSSTTNTARTRLLSLQSEPVRSSSPTIA